MAETKILGVDSGLHGADYRIEVDGRVYEAHLEDYPGADRIVYVAGLEHDDTPLFQAIEGAVLSDWLGLKA
jgi:hypothetical protein